MAFYLATQRKRYGLSSPPCTMSAPSSLTCYPDLITYLHTSVRIETGTALTRGMTVCDLRHPKGSAVDHLRHRTPPNCHVAIAAESARISEVVLEALLTYD
jgi:inosine-uridine nucleoside N-ribohydrolase